MELSPAVGLVLFGCLILLSVLGVPIAFALGGIGLVCAVLFLGFFPGMFLTGLTAWSSAYSYMLSMVPLYLFIGELINTSELGKDAYQGFYILLSKVRGGLALVSILASAAFAGISGSSTATAAAIGSISLPEMAKRGYSAELRTGSVAVAGTLGILIPPSIAMVFFAMLTEVSVGKLFIAGIAPGILTIVLFAIMIRFWILFRPDIAPVQQKENFTLKDKIMSIRMLLPIFILFGSLMGGIYFGMFSPTEAAGVGSIYALALVLLMRRMTWRKFATAVRETVRITAFIMLIIIGAHLFSATLAMTRLPYVLADWIIGLHIPGLGVLAVIIITTIGLGCVLDSFSLMVLTVPMFFPTIIGLGFDPIWYGILTIILVELGLITPPIAVNIYIVKALDPRAKSTDVIRGVVPFFVCELILIGLLVLFPQIPLFLPSLM